MIAGERLNSTREPIERTLEAHDQEVPFREAERVLPPIRKFRAAPAERQPA
jgi:hypothetical protein